MKLREGIAIATLLTCAVIPYTGRSQVSLCPSNIDFEQGNFSGWECMSGFVNLASGVNTLNWISFAPALGQHTIIPAGPGVDPYGGFPESCPNGSGFSVKLGNAQTGARAEAIAYTYTVPATVTVFSIFFHYAVVLQDPSHPPDEQPRFRARIFNVTDDVPIDCVNFDFTASSSLPGFIHSPTDFSVIYKDWTPITLNLTGFAGKTLRLEFITSDCTRNGHFGYAYVDVNSNCNGAISGSTVCQGDVTTTLTAPYGFQSYAWFSDISFSTIVSTSQTYNVTPPPTVGTVYPVVITPFPGFGCQDTVYATISLSEKPVANAGPDATLCSYQQAQLGSTGNPQLSYSWSPPAQVTNPASPTPFTQTNLTAPQTFYLKVVDNITGCINYDTVTITPVDIDTSLSGTGGLAYCEGDIINTHLQLAATGTGIQWYQQNSAIPGATGLFYDPRPLTSTVYWARLSKSGCFDSTRQVLVNVAPKPDPAFTFGRPDICMNIPVNLNNTTTIPSSEPLRYSWRISDGMVSDDKHIIKTFTTPGNFDIKLLALSGSGCADSITKSVQVLEHCGVYVPNGFTPNNDGKNDVFRPYLSGAKKFHRFLVFDRAGTLIYSTQTIGEGWDGTYKGIKLNPAVFTWMLEYDSPERDKVIMKGTVMLLR